MPIANRVTEAMLVNHGSPSAVLLRVDGSQKADKCVESIEMSAADTRSRLKTDTRQRGAYGSCKDEDKLRAMCDHMLKCVRGIGEKELTESHY